MRCHACGEEAIGICVFCGRGVCAQHHREQPNILAIFNGRDGVPKTVFVADALFCGTCRPQPEPVAIPEFY
jgi:hypothetical protein